MAGKVGGADGAGSRPRLLAAAGALSLALASCVPLEGVPPGPRPYPAPAPGAGGVQRLPPAPHPAPAMPERVGRLRILPDRADFGELDVGEAAHSVVTLANEGWGPLRIDAVAVLGEPAFAVARDGCTGRLLRPREECGVELRFAPDAPGRLSGALRVASSDPVRPAADLPLQGTGRPSRRGTAALSPGRLDFGEVEVGGERILHAEVRNRGGGRLRVRAASAEGRAFRIVADLCSRADLGPGQGCRIAVGFSPPRRERFPGTLRVVTDEPRAPEVSAELAGEGVAARPRCPRQRLEPLGGARDADRGMTVRGRLPREQCLTYAVRVREEGRLVVCVPPGYRLEAGGFRRVREGECRPGDAAAGFRAYRSRRLPAGTDVDGLTITRRDDAPADFRLVLRLEPRRGDDRDEDDSEGEYEDADEDADADEGGPAPRPGPRPFPPRR